MENFLSALGHTAEDCFKLLPFLLAAYLVMEVLERRAGNRAEKLIAGAGKSGPLIGALLGVFPQCGFSGAASNFYSAGLINMGTLIAVFMSTSDEMLPLFIAEEVAPRRVLGILAAKALIAVVSGYVVMLLFSRFFRKSSCSFESYRRAHAHDCSGDGHGLIVEVLIRTGRTFAFVFLITLVLDWLMASAGEDIIRNVLRATPVLGELLAGLVGLIPNCAASILISQLYLQGVIGTGAMMSGLLVSAGVGLLVLFEENRNIRENLTILSILYVLSVGWGLLTELFTA